MFGKKSEQRCKHPLREAISVLVLFPIAMLIVGKVLDIPLMSVLRPMIAIDVVSAVLAYWVEKRGNKPILWLLVALLIGEFVVLPAYIWFAGYDCEPPDDLDLMVQEDVNWGPEQEKEFAAFTNVLVRVEHLVEDDDDIKYEEAVRILASNEWVFAGIDQMALSDKFSFPPLAACGDEEIDMGKILCVRRALCDARMRLAVEKQEFEDMLTDLDLDLRVGEHYLLHGTTLVDYLVGLNICKNTICGLRDLVQRNAFPDSVLQKIDERVRLIKGQDNDALFRAYKNEYAYQTCHEMAEWRKIIRRSFGRLSCLLARYLCQPNRTKSYLGAQIRNEMELIRTGRCVRPDDNRNSPWYVMFIDREWLGRDMMSGLRGRGHDLHETIAAGLALRTQIACKRYEMKYGHRPADIAALVPEFLPDVPLSPCDGKAVALDLAADKIHIGGCKVEELRIGEPKDK